MSESSPQSYQNHKRIVPGYHIAVFGLLFVNLIWRIVALVRGPGLDAVMELLLALALLGLCYYVRAFPLVVQDRLIRLEMRLRLERLLDQDLHSRVGELTPRQLVALRFASDAELPQLVRAVLAGEIQDADAIKQRIGDWQPDTLRV